MSQTISRTFDAAREKVFNRGRPPTRFLNELVDWGIGAPDAIFQPNDRNDVYTAVRDELGPWEGPLHRRAVMLEVLRVLAGFESSWDWNAGRDTTNPSSGLPCTEEAGILQCSGNSMDFDPSLKEYMRQITGRTDCDTFRTETKRNHPFALEYTARLLRFTTRHHGPLKRREVNQWLRRSAVEELASFLGAE